MTVDDLTGNANDVREILAATLAAEGLISQEAADKITNDYSILVVEKGLLGKTIDRIFGTSDTPRYQLVKLINTIRNENDDNQSEGST
jgi:uncharacterized protein YjcR